ncbi:MAG: Eco57I restriction-modification methylase domain-containing protein [Verrucomicrobia bacterium]|nr:Eco57I restriction-modification methylase domain-containing protein [Verrucomicrobiota bacterium]
MPRAQKRVHDHPDLLGMPEVRRLWHNDELFSDHYVKGRLSKNDWWPSDDAARPVWEFCRDLYNQRYLALAKNNEAFTRQELIDRVLEKLGFAWTDNLGLPDQDTEPDYILFISQTEKEAVLEKDKASRYRASAAILEAKKLNHPLSQVSRHQQRYPHQQIRDYLQDARVLAWGILTNGNEWRLYGRDARRQDFFAINYEVAIQSLENFKVFLAFFSPAAFQRDARDRCRLDFIREQSLSAQSQLEEDLRQRVYTILTNLANGFASRPENQIPDTDDGRKALYESCLIYLYRLLFLLYAEGRGLLPVEPRTRRYFKELSLERLKPDLKNFAAYDSHTRTRLGEDIGELFHLVNGTDEAKNKEYSVARYNGGLFDPAQHPLLENWRIADADLASVLRGLMFDPPPKPNEPALPIQTVDFGDLRVQQLGSIYEGLLEHHFARDAAGRLELKTDKAERKATGTYYTPDYIVKYIVGQTLTPLLDEIERSEPVRAALGAKRQDNSFADAVLALNVCDPAMGSGHFLVEATTFLADHIAAHPTTRRLHEKSKDEEELAYWRRRVVEACIYGVDLNPLAVELAKLSLWLTCIASDQPLNFLDHHLRCGNSLIGARLDQLGGLPDKKAKRGAAAKQLGFTFGPDFKRAVADTITAIKAIESEASGDVAKVKGKERRWAAEILPRLAPYKRVADLWTGTFFGEELDEETYVTKAQEILEPPAGAKTARATRAQARRTADSPPYQPHSRRFFHWELEFPDVFFADDGSLKSNPGFDAVIGNPPYVSALELTKSLSEFEKPFWTQQFETARGAYDLYILFLELAARLAAPTRLSSLITPNKFLSAPYAEGFRDYCCRSLMFRRLFNLSRVKVFNDPSVYPVITVFENSRPRAGYEFLVEEPIDRNAPLKTTTVAQSSDFLSKLPEKLWGYLLSEHLALVLKAERVSSPFEDCAVVRASTTAGEADAFTDALADEPQRNGMKFINTGLIDRFTTKWGLRPLTHAGRILKTPHLDLSHPSVSPERRKLFSSPKIVFAKMALRPEAFLDSTGEFASANTNVALDAKLDLNYLAALVNSQLLAVLYGAYFGALRMSGGYFQFQAPQLRLLPIRGIDFATSAQRRTALLAKARTIYELREVAGLLAFVDEQLCAKPERSDVVHDLLAFLGERMMDLNREQRATARQFFTDMHDFYGIEARALNPKTKLDEFWKLETAELFTHLNNNLEVLAAVNLELDEPTELKIRSRFEKTRAAILPLEAQIAFTDRLIDQIVYRLYGLTDEEIKTVENTVATESRPASQVIAPPATIPKPKRVRRKKSAYAEPPPPPAKPGITPEQAYADAAHFYYGKEDSPPYRTEPPKED